MTIKYLDSKRVSALSSDFPTTTTTYDHIGDTNNAGLHAINTAGGHDGTKVGIKIIAGSSAIGTKIEYVSMSIRKWGSSSGNYQFQVIDGTDGTTVLASATSSASALTETPATVELQLDSVVTLSVNDRIVLSYPDGSGSNIVGIARNSTTTESGYNRSILGYSTTTWTDSTTNNIIMTFDSSPASISKPTNVQDNSILVEKDTANRYWFDAEEIPSSTQLYEGSNSDSDISTTGGSTNFNINSTVSNALYFNPQRSSSIFGQTWDLGSNLSETAWVLRAKMNITSLDNSGDTVRLFIGMNNQDSSVGAGNSSNKFIGAGSFINSGGQQWYRVSVKGNTLDVAEANQHTIATGILYIEIIRKTETTYSVRWTTSSDFTGGTLVDNQTVGSHGGSGSTSSMALRYFWMSNINVNGNQDAHIQGHLEDVKIYDGVTSVPATWTLET